MSSSATSTHAQDRLNIIRLCIITSYHACTARASRFREVLATGSSFIDASILHPRFFGFAASSSTWIACCTDRRHSGWVRGIREVAILLWNQSNFFYPKRINFPYWSNMYSRVFAISAYSPQVFADPTPPPTI